MFLFYFLIRVALFSSADRKCKEAKQDENYDDISVHTASARDGGDNGSDVMVNAEVNNKDDDIDSDLDFDAGINQEDFECKDSSQ